MTQMNNLDHFGVKSANKKILSGTALFGEMGHNGISLDWKPQHCKVHRWEFHGGESCRGSTEKPRSNHPHEPLEGEGGVVNLEIFTPHTIRL